MQQVYSYCGPVVDYFGKCIVPFWKGTTYAISKQKAKCNLKYQFKKQNNMLPGTKIELPGEVIVE